MEINYRRDAEKIYLVLTVEDPPDAASYQLRMLLTNRIPGLLPCRVSNMDQKTLFYYEIPPGYQALKDILLRGSVKASAAACLISGLLKARKGLRDYLLRDEGLLLSSEMVFLNLRDEAALFCFLPGSGRNFSEDMRILGELFLAAADRSDPEDFGLTCGFYRACTEGIVTTEKLQMLLQQLQKPESPARIETRSPGQAGTRSPGQAETMGSWRAGKREPAEYEKAGQQPAFPESSVNRSHILNDFMAPDDDDRPDRKDRPHAAGILIPVLGASACVAAAVLLHHSIPGIAAAAVVFLLLFVLTDHLYRKKEARSQEEAMERCAEKYSDSLTDAVPGAVFRTEALPADADDGETVCLKSV